MLSVKELANALGVSGKTIYALVERDAIPFYRIGTGRGTLRFEIDEVKHALRKERSRSTDRELPRLKHLR